MHHKNIKQIIRKQLKKQYPNWKQLSKKQKKAISKAVLNERRHRDRSSFFTLLSFFFIFKIFLSSFLSFLILSLTRLHAWETPDSPTPK